MLEALLFAGCDEVGNRWICHGNMEQLGVVEGRHRFRCDSDIIVRTAEIQLTARGYEIVLQRQQILTFRHPISEVQILSALVE
jgi:hypothetical protein